MLAAILQYQFWAALHRHHRCILIAFARCTATSIWNAMLRHMACNFVAAILLRGTDMASETERPLQQLCGANTSGW